MQKPEVQINCLKWIKSQIIQSERLRVEPAPRNKWQRPATAEKESKKRKSLEWKQWNKCEIDTQPCWIQLSSDCWSCQRSCMAFGSIWRSPTMPVTKEKVSRRLHFHVYARFWQARGAMRHILTQNWVIRRCCSMPANADSSHFSFTVHVRQECAPGETEFIAAFHVSSIAHRALVTHKDSSPQIDNRFSVDGLKGHFSFRLSCFSSCRAVSCRLSTLPVLISFFLTSKSEIRLGVSGLGEANESMNGAWRRE